MMTWWDLLEVVLQRNKAYITLPLLGLQWRYVLSYHNIIINILFNLLNIFIIIFHFAFIVHSWDWSFTVMRQIEPRNWMSFLQNTVHIYGTPF